MSLSGGTPESPAIPKKVLTNLGIDCKTNSLSERIFNLLFTNIVVEGVSDCEELV